MTVEAEAGVLKAPDGTVLGTVFTPIECGYLKAALRVAEDVSDLMPGVPPLTDEEREAVTRIFAKLDVGADQ